MKTLITLFVLIPSFLLSTQPIFAARNLACERACYARHCPNQHCATDCYYDNSGYYYHQVNNPCVDFCLDYHHPLTFCQRACSI